MTRAIRNNSLGIVFGLLFLICLAGQAIAGHIAYNSEQLEHGGEAISLGRYLTSSDFGQAVMENWQSEYLQFLVFLMLTIWLLQRGSPESKKLDQATLQNWQSEFLAVGSFAVFAVYLRQRGSPESKPIGAAHTDTGLES